MAGLQTGHDAGLLDLALDPEDHLDARKPGRLADVVDLLAFDHPEPPGVDFIPFFSTDSASGSRAATARKLVRIASSNSGWLSLTANRKSRSASRRTRAKGL